MNFCIRHGDLAESCHQHGLLDCQILPALEAEPYYEQYRSTTALPQERTADGKFDKSSLDPERRYRLNRDYVAHALRYGWPMRVLRANYGAGATIAELGCGADLPMFRTMVMDLSATSYYKPKRYVGVDLNKIRYKPQVSGINSVYLENTNLLRSPEVLPDWDYDLIISFEVLEHMGKEDGLQFLEIAVNLAKTSVRRKLEAGQKKPTCMILLSTPVGNGLTPKNHIYEWKRSELQRAWNHLGVRIAAQFGMFSNLTELQSELTEAEWQVFRRLTRFHSPETLVSMFSCLHPSVARNIAWEIVVSEDSL